ncbi:hypothetical protein ACFQGX_10580 [Nonomuraea dietziae]|uniref:hypothetical protein n=1 Tax=Nonomuraea dietziae TaxID=65515 RepID=UPI00361102DC
MNGSSGEGLDISRADLRGTGAGLGETGTTWLEAVGALRAHLEGEGDPWGEDVESMVKAGYLAVTRKALEVFEALGERQVTSGTTCVPWRRTTGTRSSAAERTPYGSGGPSSGCDARLPVGSPVKPVGRGSRRVRVGQGEPALVPVSGEARREPGARPQAPRG